MLGDPALFILRQNHTMIWVPITNVLTSPILKAPLQMTEARVVTWAQRPPNPPPLKDESAKYGSKRDSLSNVSGVKIAVFINNVSDRVDVHAMS